MKRDSTTLLILVAIGVIASALLDYSLRIRRDPDVPRVPFLETLLNPKVVK